MKIQIKTYSNLNNVNIIVTDVVDIGYPCICGKDSTIRESKVVGRGESRPRFYDFVNIKNLGTSPLALWIDAGSIFGKKSSIDLEINKEINIHERCASLSINNLIRDNSSVKMTKFAFCEI